MATLLDRLNQIKGQQPQPEQSGIERILQEKSGKILPQKGPRASSLREQAGLVAVGEGLREQQLSAGQEELGLRQQQSDLDRRQALETRAQKTGEETARERLQAQVNLRRQQIQQQQSLSLQSGQRQQERKLAQMSASADMKIRDLASIKKVKYDDIFSEFRASSLELEQRSDAARLEQVAFNLAMSDRAYLEELDRVGQERQLEQSLNYDNEISRLVMGEKMSSLLDDLGFKKDMDAKSRQFQERLVSIDIDTALQIGQITIDTANARAKMEAIGNLATVGARYVAEKSSEKTD